MNSIITTSLKKITLNSKFLSIQTPNGEVDINIKQLLSEPVNSDSAYINATQIAKLYSKRPNDLFRADGWDEYVKEMQKQVNFNYNNNDVIKMVKTVRGRHHSGTWLHSKLIVEFLRKLDVTFAVAMDLFIQELIIHSNEIKIERDNTKILFKGLTETIKDIYIPAQESENAKKFAYNNLSGLINQKVLGCTGTKYAKDNDVEVEQGKSIRDYLSKEQLDEIVKAEEDLNGYIKYAKITDYEQLKVEVLK